MSTDSAGAAPLRARGDWLADLRPGPAGPPTGRVVRGCAVQCGPGGGAGGDEGLACARRDPGLRAGNGRAGRFDRQRGRRVPARCRPGSWSCPAAHAATASSVHGLVQARAISCGQRPVVAAQRQVLRGDADTPAGQAFEAEGQNPQVGGAMSGPGSYAAPSPAGAQLGPPLPAIARGRRWEPLGELG